MHKWTQVYYYFYEVNVFSLIKHLMNVSANMC